jgi:hypothetical protein
MAPIVGAIKKNIKNRGDILLPPFYKTAHKQG